MRLSGLAGTMERRVEVPVGIDGGILRHGVRLLAGKEELDTVLIGGLEARESGALHRDADRGGEW